MNKEVKELIDTLKEYANGFANVLAPTEESVKALLDYINKLEERIAYLERSNNRREEMIIELRHEIGDYNE